MHLNLNIAKFITFQSSDYVYCPRMLLAEESYCSVIIVIILCKAKGSVLIIKILQAKSSVASFYAYLP